MKTKNLILGLSALVFAFGSAFTSVLVSPTADSVFVAEIMDPEEQCQEIPEQSCNDLSTQPCQVRVILNGSNVGNKDVNDLTTCAEPKFDDRQQPINQVSLNVSE
jgi:hypothetical protein